MLKQQSVVQEANVRGSIVNCRFFLGAFLFVLFAEARAQQEFSPCRNPTQVQIAALVQEVSETQGRMMRSAGVGVSYRSHWRSLEQDETTEVIGSADGSVSRLLAQNGQSISADKNDKEEKRLLTLLNPIVLRNAGKNAVRLQPYFLELVRAMPRAMLYTTAPDQPQKLYLNHRSIVLDYSPNPAFLPHSLAEGTLGKLSGRLWIDAVDDHLLRMEIHIDQDVNVAGGVLFKVYRGGTVQYEQRPVSGDHYTWTHIQLHLRVREFVLKSFPLDADLTADDIQLLSSVPNGQDAVRSLLAMQVKTR